MKKKILFFLAVLILLCAFGIVQYYIWGNAFITEYQADCTDTLFWAQATLESGSLFKPTFDYAYRLAFGGQWLFMPFLKTFGVSLMALRCGMCLFSVLFTLVLVFFFRSIHFKWHGAFLSAAVMLLAVCSTKKTREIFYGHIIHYSLSVFYLLLAFIFLRLFLSAGTLRKRVLPLFLLSLSLFMCSANGTVQILYVTLPILAGCLLEFYLSRERKLLPIIICTILACGAGYLFSSSYSTLYSSSYSVIVPFSEWDVNLLNFPKRWISLFYTLPVSNLDAFSPTWIKWVFKTVIALAMLVGFALSFSRYKNFPDQEERIFIFTSWAMFAAFLFFFVFGRVSDVDWRLLPLVFSAEIVILILFHQVLPVELNRTLSGCLAWACGLMLTIHAVSSGLAVLRIPYDKKIWYAENGLLETLKANDLDYGYITSYWLSNSLTVLADDRIQVRFVAMNEDGDIYLNPFNSDMDWYADQPERDRWFLALTDVQYGLRPDLAEEASEIYTCIQEDTHNYRTDTLYILVLNRNIVQDEYERLFPRYVKGER